MLTPRYLHVPLGSLAWLAMLLLIATPCASIFGWILPSLKPATKDQQRLQHTLYQRVGTGFQRTVANNSSIWDDDAVTTEEFSVMQRATDALKAYDHKPDCFKEAARALRHDCRNIEMDEDEKTKYAIRLTGCEIATAQIPVPIECREISDSVDKKQEDCREPTSADVTRCVQSLGRVPQLWTSYSGYFREVKVMCLAVRYSLEHEDLRNMQKNLTISHAEQIALLREQRRELIETHHLETVRLQEILDLHSTITHEVESMLSSAGSLRDTLGSIYNDITRIARSSEHSATQQSVALSNFQDMNNHIMAEYQATMQHTLGSVAQAIQTWHESLIEGLSRSQELDRLGENFMSRIIDSNEGLDSVMHKVNTAKDRLQDLTETAVEGTQSLLNLQDTAVKEMQASTNALFSNMIEALKSLEADSQATWQSIFEALKTGSSNLHEEVSAVLQETMSDVESMATSSQEKIEELNRIVSEFQAKQGNVIWQLQALHKTLRFFTVATMDRMSVAEVAAFSTIVGAIFLFSGIRTVLLLLVSTTVVSAGCDQLSVRVSFMHVLLSMLFLALSTRLLLARRCRFDAPTVTSNEVQKLYRHCESQSAAHQDRMTLHYDYGDYWDMYEDAVDRFGPPPYDSQEEAMGQRKVTSFTYSGRRKGPLGRTDSGDDKTIMATTRRQRADPLEDLYEECASFGLSLGSYA